MMGERKVNDTVSRRKKLLAAGLCVWAIMLQTGCGAESNIFDSVLDSDIKSSSGGSSYTISEGYDSYESSNGYREESGIPSAEPGTSNLQDVRKLIQKVTLEVETKEFEQMMWALDGQIKELGGYIESMNTYNGSSYYGGDSRYANLTVRIPQAKLSQFLDTVSDEGNIVRRSEDVDDVTLSYVDMESRRNVLRSEQERLLEFMDRAETIEEIITIEERLSEVRYQLESMESQLRTIDNLVDYSTVYLNISEVRELTPIKEPTAGQRISEGFLESVEDIINGLTEFGIWFLVNIPYFVIWIGVLAIVIILLRVRRKKLVAKKEAQRQKEEEQLRRANEELQKWKNE